VRMAPAYRTSRPSAGHGSHHHQLHGRAAGILCVSALQSFLDPAEWSSLVAAVELADWATCVEIITDIFAVSADGADALEIGRLRRAVLSKEPGCPQSWWIDPRIDDERWGRCPPLEQWVAMASFITHVVGRLKHVAGEWANDSRAQLGMSMALCREGYMQEALMVSTPDLSLALTDVLIEMLMCSGTLGPIKGSDGRTFCLIAEILEKGVGALFYGLSIAKFRREVALKSVDYIRVRRAPRV